MQGSLFQVFNSLVRASPESREAVLQYFARVISLNSKRAGTHVRFGSLCFFPGDIVFTLKQVDYTTVSSDSFMVNLQTVMLRFAEPFMDANYTKASPFTIYGSHSPFSQV